MLPDAGAWLTCVLAWPALQLNLGMAPHCSRVLRRLKHHGAGPAPTDAGTAAVGLRNTALYATPSAAKLRRRVERWGLEALLPTTRTVHAEVLNQLECVECGTTRFKQERFYVMSLDVPNEVASGAHAVLDDLLQDFFRPKVGAIGMRCHCVR